MFRWPCPTYCFHCHKNSRHVLHRKVSFCLSSLLTIVLNVHSIHRWIDTKQKKSVAYDLQRYLISFHLLFRDLPRLIRSILFFPKRERIERTWIGWARMTIEPWISRSNSKRKSMSLPILSFLNWTKRRMNSYLLTMLQLFEHKQQMKSICVTGTLRRCQ